MVVAKEPNRILRVRQDGVRHGALLHRVTSKDLAARNIIPPGRGQDEIVSRSFWRQASSLVANDLTVEVFRNEDRRLVGNRRRGGSSRKHELMRRVAWALIGLVHGVGPA